jgi:uncharacterized protein
MFKKQSPGNGWPDLRPLDAEKERPWVLGVAFALVIVLGLCLTYLTTHPARRHAIPFYPGRYEHVAMNSGEAVSEAMHAVYIATDATALNAAIAAVQKMVDAGDAEAAFRLGRYYHLESEEPDYALALKYYRIAFDENHAWATNNLGLLYRDGLGVAQNERQAYEYFQRAARQNNPWAYVNLADMTFSERAAPADVRAGITWLEKGAAHHCTLCLIDEAAIYHSGAYGVHSDPGKTAALLRTAAALGDSQAALILAELYIVGDGVPQSSARSLQILKTLSDHGYADATNLLGELSADRQIRNYLFESSLGGVRQIPADLSQAFPQDPAIAIRYWQLASRQGSCQSLIDLSSLFDRGVGVRLDYQRAADYVERAVSCDPMNSFYLWKLGMRFYDAKGVKQNCEAAERLFTQSLYRGDPEAAVNLGYIYDKGCGSIARDDHRAFQIYLLGAKQDVPLCQNNVGALLKHGRGVKAADPARGYAWIKLAAMRGEPLAKKNLGDPLFTPEVRVAGLADLADIKRRLLTVPDDPRAIMRDPWY